MGENARRTRADESTTVDRAGASTLPSAGKQSMSARLRERAGDDVEPPAGFGYLTGAQPLPGGVRAHMEHAFGADFGDVRVHEGPHAAELGALAYTQGTDIHFAPGQYQPASASGLELLGHELAHVVQQRQGDADARQAQLADRGAAATTFGGDAVLEAEADLLGARAARGERVRVDGRGRGLQAKLGAGRADQLLLKLAKRYPEVVSAKGVQLRPLLSECNDLDDALDLIYDYMGKNQETRTITRAQQGTYDVTGRLALAEAAIQHVKSLFPQGSGNQLEAQWVSLGNAGARAEATKAMNPVARPETREDQRQSTANDAAAVGLGGGGTCRQYAAAVYAFLAGKVKAPVNLVGTSGDHTFVVIGDIGAETDETLVAADAWPSVAQALRMSEHFSGGKRNVVVKMTDQALPHARLQVDPDKAGQALAATPDPSTDDLLGTSSIELAPSGASKLTLIHYLVEKDERPSLVRHGIHFDAHAPLTSAGHETGRLKGMLGPSPAAASPRGAGSQGIDLSAALQKIEDSWLEHDQDLKAAGEVLALGLDSGQKAAVLEWASHTFGEDSPAYARLVKDLP